MAHRALVKLLSMGQSLGEYLRGLTPPTFFRNGYQVGGETGTQQSSAHLHGLPDLKGRRLGNLPFLIAPKRLPRFERTTLRNPYDLKRYEPPLLIVRETFPADPLFPRALRADSAIAFSESFDAVSFAGVCNGEDHARWLQLLLQSNVGRFLALMMDARFGVERDTIYQESQERIPLFPLSQLNQDQLLQMRTISKSIERCSVLDAAQFNALNSFVFDLYELGALERQAIEDTLQTCDPASACVKRAATPPQTAECQAFMMALKASLNDVLQASGKAAHVDEVPASLIPWRILSIATGKEPVPRVQLNTFLEQANRSGASLVVCPTRPDHVFVGLPDRYRYWTQTQAVLLAHELLDGVLGHV